MLQKFLKTIEIKSVFKQDPTSTLASALKTYVETQSKDQWEKNYFYTLAPTLFNALIKEIESEHSETALARQNSGGLDRLAESMQAFGRRPSKESEIKTTYRHQIKNDLLEVISTIKLTTSPQTTISFFALQTALVNHLIENKIDVEQKKLIEQALDKKTNLGYFMHQNRSMNYKLVMRLRKKLDELNKPAITLSTPTETTDQAKNFLNEVAATHPSLFNISGSAVIAWQLKIKQALLLLKNSNRKTQDSYFNQIHSDALLTLEKADKNLANDYFKQIFDDANSNLYKWMHKKPSCLFDSTKVLAKLRREYEGYKIQPSDINILSECFPHKMAVKY